ILARSLLLIEKLQLFGKIGLRLLHLGKRLRCAVKRFLDFDVHGVSPMTDNQSLKAREMAFAVSEADASRCPSPRACGASAACAFASQAGKPASRRASSTARLRGTKSPDFVA